jgi:hypothetical protein
MLGGFGQAGAFGARKADNNGGRDVTPDDWTGAHGDAHLRTMRQRLYR